MGESNTGVRLEGQAMWRTECRMELDGNERTATGNKSWGLRPVFQSVIAMRGAESGQES